MVDASVFPERDVRTAPVYFGLIAVAGIVFRNRGVALIVEFESGQPWKP